MGRATNTPFLFRHEMHPHQHLLLTGTGPAAHKFHASCPLSNPTAHADQGTNRHGTFTNASVRPRMGSGGAPGTDARKEIERERIQVRDTASGRSIKVVGRIQG
jgi:hypothetical protein